MSVPPMSKVVTDTSPAMARAPSARVIRSVSSVCPIWAPSIFTLSITASVTALFVPRVTPSIAPPFTSATGITVDPVKVTLPFANVIKSGSFMCPSSLPSILIAPSKTRSEPVAGASKHLLKMW